MFSTVINVRITVISKCVHQGFLGYFLLKFSSFDCQKNYVLSIVLKYCGPIPDTIIYKASQSYLP